ncbi:hypothetical protein GCM10011507_33920 [Edaphobacter acidisoli]|uniref:Uncharacterized protein n=1 Tax=Edaphobacter acidisoli TaxID=2040573 RepID=A0A916S190_9BACT|nr:hypothetical protein GCM10011507_33920 [Edaphobacter acidisoli]
MSAIGATPNTKMEDVEATSALLSIPRIVLKIPCLSAKYSAMNETQ